MDQDKITISDAVNQLQEWFQQKEFEKVILGAKEILAIDPNNEVAKNLLKQSEISLLKNSDHPQENNILEKAASEPDTPQNNPPNPQDIQFTPQNTQSTPQNAQSTPQSNPIDDISFPEIGSNMPEKENTSQNEANPILDTIQNSPSDKDLSFPGNTDSLLKEESDSRHFIGYLLHKVVTIVIFFAIIGGIGYGAFAGYQYYQKQQEKPADTNERKNTENEISAEEEARTKNNTERDENLEQLKTAIENYYEKEKKYPPVKTVEKELIEGKYLETIPVDPLHNQTDRFENLYGYAYAVYDTEAGKNQDYIISGKYESGSNVEVIESPNDTEKYADFRDFSKSNVKILDPENIKTGDETPENIDNTPETPDDETPPDETPETSPKKKIKRVAPTSVESPSEVTNISEIISDLTENKTENKGDL